MREELLQRRRGGLHPLLGGHLRPGLRLAYLPPVHSPELQHVPALHLLQNLPGRLQPAVPLGLRLQFFGHLPDLPVLPGGPAPHPVRQLLLWHMRALPELPSAPPVLRGQPRMQRVSLLQPAPGRPLLVPHRLDLGHKLLLLAVRQQAGQQRVHRLQQPGPGLQVRVQPGLHGQRLPALCQGILRAV